MSIAAEVRHGAGEVVATMKAIGLDVGDYRLSIYSLFASLVVAVLLYAGVQIVLRAVKWLLRRNGKIDDTQRILTEKLVAIGLFTLAMLMRATCGMIQHRSEEHTSELQSLMRISYAVFCLKKKTRKQTQEYESHHTAHSPTQNSY